MIAEKEWGLGKGLYFASKVIAVIYLITVMTMVYRFVRKVELDAEKYTFTFRTQKRGKDQTRKRSRRILLQGVLYTANTVIPIVVLICYFILGVLLVSAGAWTRIIAVIFLPLQGLFNVLIYMIPVFQHTMHKRRKRLQRERKDSTLKATLKGSCLLNTSVARKEDGNTNKKCFPPCFSKCIQQQAAPPKLTHMIGIKNEKKDAPQEQEQEKGHGQHENTLNNAPATGNESSPLVLNSTNDSDTNNADTNNDGKLVSPVQFKIGEEEEEESKEEIQPHYHSAVTSSGRRNKDFNQSLLMFKNIVDLEECDVEAQEQQEAAPAPVTDESLNQASYYDETCDEISLGSADDYLTLMHDE